MEVRVERVEVIVEGVEVRIERVHVRYCRDACGSYSWTSGWMLLWKNVEVRVERVKHGFWSTSA